MENYKNKTTALGAFMVAVGVAKSLFPEYVQWMDQEPSTLVMFGLGLVAGRDALRKLIP